MQQVTLWAQVLQMLTSWPHASWFLGETHPHHVPTLCEGCSQSIYLSWTLHWALSTAMKFLYYILLWYITVFKCLQMFTNVYKCLQMFTASLLSMHCYTCFCSVAPLRSQQNFKRISLRMFEILHQSAAQRKANSEARYLGPCLESNWRDKKRSTKTVCQGSSKFQFPYASWWQRIQVQRI